jgi:hypothetical protein
VGFSIHSEGPHEFVDAARFSEKTVRAQAMKLESPTSDPPAGPASSPPAHRPHFSEEVERLIAAFAERAVRLRDVLEVMHSRGYTVLLILLSLPFCTPIPMPGLSAPFGLVIAFIGLRLALGQKPWLPARLLDTQLPPKFFPRFLAATRRLLRWLEHFLKPRLSHLVRWPLARRVIGAMICVSGLLMTLPFPIPFSNGLPAMAVLLLAAAMLEEDGYFAIGGGVVFILALAFFAAIFWGGTEIVNYLKEAFGDVFKPDDQPAPQP